jgi:hypothetical protein
MFLDDSTNFWNQLKVSLFGVIDWRQIVHHENLVPFFLILAGVATGSLCTYYAVKPKDQVVRAKNQAATQSAQPLNVLCTGMS